MLLTAGGQRKQRGNSGAAGSSGWRRLRACHCPVFRARQGLTLLLLLVGTSLVTGLNGLPQDKKVVIATRSITPKPARQAVLCSLSWTMQDHSQIARAMLKGLLKPPIWISFCWRAKRCLSFKLGPLGFGMSGLEPQWPCCCSRWKGSRASPGIRQGV